MRERVSGLWHPTIKVPEPFPELWPLRACLTDADDRVVSVGKCAADMRLHFFVGDLAGRFGHLGPKLDILESVKE